MAVRRSITRNRTYRAWFATQDELLEFFGFVESAFGQSAHPEGSKPWTDRTLVNETGDATAIGSAAEVLTATPARRVQSISYEFPTEYDAKERVNIRMSNLMGFKMEVRGEDPVRVHALLSAISEEAWHYAPWWRVVLGPWFIPVNMLFAATSALLLGWGVNRNLKLSSSSEVLLTFMMELIFVAAAYTLSNPWICPRFQVLLEGQSPRAYIFFRTIIGVLATSVVGAIISLAFS